MQCTIFNLLVRRRRASYHVDVFCAWLSVGSLSVKSKSTPEIIYGLSPIMKYEMPAVQSVLWWMPGRNGHSSYVPGSRQAKCKKIAWSSEISWAGTYQICCKTAMTRLRTTILSSRWCYLVMMCSAWSGVILWPDSHHHHHQLFNGDDVTVMI